MSKIDRKLEIKKLRAINFDQSTDMFRYADEMEKAKCESELLREKLFIANLKINDLERQLMKRVDELDRAHDERESCYLV
tara:strand:+ start:158 stop:397 length:240 start_codon:yes stop_codon:yes gene_type:complete